MRNLLLTIALAAAAPGLTATAAGYLEISPCQSGITGAPCIAPAAISTAQNTATTHKAATMAVSSIADLTGERVMTYETLVSDSYDGGSSVTIAAVEGTDSITITNFWSEGIVVKALVDITAMTISIPNQTLGSYSDASYDYGSYDLAFCNMDATPDRTADIVGTIATDGSITITSYWGIFVASGDYMDNYYGLYYHTQIEPTNATMSYNARSSDGTLTTCTFGVVTWQNTEESIYVKNFFNRGGTVKISLSYDSLPIIESQTAFTTARGKWNTYSCTYNDSYTTVAAIEETINCDKATSARAISWGVWNMFCVTTATTYWNGVYIVDGRIDTNADILYPQYTDLELYGNGTADDPYLVRGAGEWNALATYMSTHVDSLSGKYVRLADDIDFTDTTIRQLGYNRVEIFNGDLDGNGKTLKGFSATADAKGFGGIIITAGEDACVHDLTVEGSVTAGYNYCGGTIGYLYGSAQNVTSNVTMTSTASYCAGMVGYLCKNASLTGCVNTATVTGTATYTAGLVAYADTASSLTGCFNDGAVTNTLNYTAGLVAKSMNRVTYSGCGNRAPVTNVGTLSSSYTAGLVCYASPCTMVDCFNEAAVSTSGESSGYAAGVVFYAYAKSSDTDTFTFTGCYNTGDITAAFYTAGVLAYSSTSATVTMDGCYNTGNITSNYTSTKGNTYTAGVAACYNRNSTYTGCWNSGKIASTAPVYVGGVFAYYKGTGSSTSTTIFKGCYNTGDVEGQTNYVGGVIAYVANYTSVDSCYNTGNVTGTYYVGGVAGYMYGIGVTMTNSWNAGDITATLNRVGGVVGYDIQSSTISKCFNVGDVTCTNTEQGVTAGSSGFAVGGIAGYTGATMTDVYNAGTITGSSVVGGLVGSTSAGATSIYRGYSCGKVEAPADTCGNIVGNSIIANGSSWNSSNTLSSTYYLLANDAVGTARVSDNKSTGLTYAALAALNMGTSWTAGDGYTYPLLSSAADNDYAKAHAAAVIPAEGDSYDSITGDFHVGTPDGVTWTASSAAVSIDGNAVTFGETFEGTLTMTATAGDVSVATYLTCDVSVSGVGTVTDGDGRTIASERYFTPSGAEVIEPQGDATAIYIVVRTYTDGSVAVAKEVK